MSPKKNKRSQAAQQLIEDLLDEPASQPTGSRPPAFVKLDDQTGSFGEHEAEPISNLVIEGELSADEVSLHLEISQDIILDPVARANLTATTEKPKRFTDEPTQASPEKNATSRKAVRPPPPPAPIAHNSASADFDFGDLTDDEKAEAPAVANELSDERTVKVQTPQTLVSPPEPRSEVRPDVRSEVIPITRNFDRGGATEIRAGLKVPPAPQVSTPAFSPAEAGLKTSESLRIAQTRITDIERELERVRRDNESLSTAGDTLRRRADELASKAESFEIQAREASQMLDEEKKVMRGQIQTKDRENAEMRARVEEIEARLESNFKKIRVRERELEHRLEIVKMESASLVSSKDKMILDLKRQIDQLHHEGDSAKNKTQEVFNQYKEKQETIRRVVRALRIALTILEGDDESVPVIKKAE